jgi:hypothetical protein
MDTVGLYFWLSACCWSLKVSKEPFAKRSVLYGDDKERFRVDLFPSVKSVGEVLSVKEAE